MLGRIYSMKSMRVLHCPTMTGGNPQGLARAERKLGLKSWAVAFSKTHFAYSSDEILWPNGQNYLRREIQRWHLFYRAMRHFDIIHFNFGSSILPSRIPIGFLKENRNRWLLRRLFNCYALLFELRDLAFLKKMGKGIVVTYQGDDARQGDYCQEHFNITFANEVGPEYYPPEEDRRKRKRIKIFGKYADRIYALNPDLLHVLPSSAEFMPYAHVDLQDWTPHPVLERNARRPLVLHAPSNQRVKGTRYVLEAVSRLQSEGIAFDFKMIETLSNSEARQVYERADLLIDQLLAGWYGGLSVELMALGKPIICYIRESDLNFIPQEMRQEIPVLNATPGTVYQVLKECLTTRKGELPPLGAKGREYVEKWHDPLKIAGRLQKTYRQILGGSR